MATQSCYIKVYLGLWLLRTTFKCNGFGFNISKTFPRAKMFKDMGGWVGCILHDAQIFGRSKRGKCSQCKKLLFPLCTLVHLPRSYIADNSI